LPVGRQEALPYNKKYSVGQPFRVAKKVIGEKVRDVRGEK
jgi:hypothetical protein